MGAIWKTDDTEPIEMFFFFRKKVNGFLCFLFYLIVFICNDLLFLLMK